MSTESGDMLWQHALPMAGNAADWLGDPGLLTDDVRRSCDDPLVLSVLHDGRARLPANVHAALPGAFSREGWQREISMRAGEMLVVHARTFAPAETIAAHDWLESLGTSPLGHALAKLGDAARVDMQYCDSTLITGDLAPPAECDGWSRRSLFEFDGLPLMLFEHFTAALLQRARLRA
ncbi:MAG: chorismate lyase [Pseudomonadota bacterium]